MNYNINNALEKLEQNLQKVDSAREQVDKTVKAYSELQGELEVCTRCFQKLTYSVESLISSSKKNSNLIFAELNGSLSSIQKSCNDINETFNSSCENVISDFNAKATNSVFKLNNTTDLIKGHVNSLYTIENSFTTSMEQIKHLKAKIEDIAKVLDLSQSSQDEVLKSISNNIVDCISVITSVKQEFISNQSKLESVIQSESLDIKKHINSCEIKTEQLLSDCIDQIIKQNDNNAIRISTNHKLILGAIILITIDIVMHFI